MHVILVVLLALLVLWLFGKVTGLWAFCHHQKLMWQFNHQTRRPEAIIRGRGDDSVYIEPVLGQSRQWRIIPGGEIVPSKKIVMIGTGRIFSGHSAF